MNNTICSVAIKSNSWNDYFILTKPKVVLVMLITAVVGMMLAPSKHLQLITMFTSCIGLALLMASAAVINHVVDRHIDCKMRRTENRPVASGKIPPSNAVIFAVVIGLTGFTILYIGSNPLTAYLTLGGLFVYAIFYTMLLKRATSQNIVIGGLAGALPPLLGWTSISGQIDPLALLLVLIIFTWTPPHFWALAIFRVEEYKKADIPMLPVTHGIAFTKTSIILYSVLLFVAVLLPYLFNFAGMFYLLGAVILSGWFCGHCIKLKLTTDPMQAIKTFRYSITYLLAIFAFLLLDRFWTFG